MTAAEQQYAVPASGKEGLLVTGSQAARILGITKRRLFIWLKGGVLPGVRDGRNYLVSRRACHEIAELISRGEWPPNATRKIG